MHSKSTDLIVDTLAKLSIDAKVEHSQYSEYFNYVVKDIETHKFVNTANLCNAKKIGYSETHLSQHFIQIMVAESTAAAIQGSVIISDDIWIWLYTLCPAIVDYVINEHAELFQTKCEPLGLRRVVDLFSRLWHLIDIAGFHRGLGVSLSSIANITCHRLEAIRLVSLEFFADSSNRFDRMLDTLLYMIVSSLMRVDAQRTIPDALCSVIDALSIVITKADESDYSIPLDSLVLLQDYLESRNESLIDIDSKVNIATVLCVLFPILVEKSNETTIPSLCALVTTLCSKLSFKETEYSALLKLHKVVMEENPKMIGHMLPSFKYLLNRSTKELSKVYQDSILHTINLIAEALDNLDSFLWTSAWECIRTAQESVGVQKELVLRIWDLALQKSVLDPFDDICKFMIRILQHFSRNSLSKSDGREKIVPVSTNGVVFDLVTIVLNRMAKEPSCIGRLHKLLIYIINSNINLLTLAIIELDHSELTANPKADVEYICHLATISEYDLFNQLFKAYRQFRNDTSKL